MKKSILWILLALALSISLCACGGAKTAQSAEEEESAVSSETAEAEDANVESVGDTMAEPEKIDLAAEIAKCTSGLPMVTLPEGTFLFQNDSCALELVNCYQDDSRNWNGVQGPEVYVTVKFYNYSNDGVMYHYIDDCYIGTEQAVTIGGGGDVAGGGKSGLFTALIAHQSADPSIDHVPMSSLEELKDVEATISWMIYDSLEGYHDESISFADVFK